ncbi:ras association domain-containing protein 7-like isoform X1 [Myripristis murdjan]|uniref:ras association domain-containing protein 7-like isoform X1 n=1 Tax=Myripristis murdjan TaxID=586833 RepID=UPI00117614FF|nr:ras association domain-containing protein 7-like isoform X1 [Myripristis murdjan]XP_029932211.1 ras association domain-containing protein 7-like isoform X1 [Myripristis murdjan]
MELKVWVEGVVRVVCGLSLDTSCQDVVIALAQAIGQTGRYVLILRFQGTERQLIADDCPLQCLAQLGQLAADVQFILRRTGPSISDGPNGSTTERPLPLHRYPEPWPHKHREPQKALTFNLGPSTVPRRTKANRTLSPSPRASPEPRASPVPFLDTLNPAKMLPSYPSKEEVFRQILKQQARLQDLDIQLRTLEREAEVWERERSSPPVAGLTLDPAEELDELDLCLRRNEAELMYGEYWEEQLQTELGKEQDMQRRLDQICLSLDDYSHQLEELHTRSAYLEQDIQVEGHRQSSRPGTPQTEEVLVQLEQELHHRLQQGEELDASLSETERELQTAEAMSQNRCQLIEELNKELRQCNLQQFIQQTGATLTSQLTDQAKSMPIASNYLCNAGIMEEALPDTVSVS